MTTETRIDYTITTPGQARPVKRERQGLWRGAPGGLGYRCEIRLNRDGAFYVGYVAQLDSAVSQGQDVESTIKNVMEAFQGCIETCVAEGMAIPWTMPRPKRKGEWSVWVVVDD